MHTEIYKGVYDIYFAQPSHSLFFLDNFVLMRDNVLFIVSRCMRQLDHVDKLATMVL